LSEVSAYVYGMKDVNIFNLILAVSSPVILGFLTWMTKEFVRSFKKSVDKLQDVQGQLVHDVGQIHVKVDMFHDRINGLHNKLEKSNGNGATLQKLSEMRVEVSQTSTQIKILDQKIDCIESKCIEINGRFGNQKASLRKSEDVLNSQQIQIDKLAKMIGQVNWIQENRDLKNTAVIKKIRRNGDIDDES